MPHKTPYNRRKMIRDFNKALANLQAVIASYRKAIENNEAISMLKACQKAGVSNSWLYHLIDNFDQYQIPDEILEELEDAKNAVKDIIIQEISGIGEDRVKWDTDKSCYVNDDSALKIARSKLKLDANKFILSKLMPKTLGDSVNVNVTANKQVNDYSVTFNSLSEDQLKQLANLKLLSNRSDNDR